MADYQLKIPSEQMPGETSSPQAGSALDLANLLEQRDLEDRDEDQVAAQTHLDQLFAGLNSHRNLRKL